MRGCLIAVLCVIGAAVYYGTWRWLVSIGFRPGWAALMVVVIAAALTGIGWLMPTGEG